MNSWGADFDRQEPNRSPHPDTPEDRGKGLMRVLVGVVISLAVIWLAILLLA